MESAEYRFADDRGFTRELVPVGQGFDWKFRMWIRQSRAETCMRSSPVVMIRPFLQESSQVLFVQRNDVIEKFSAKGTVQTLTVSTTGALGGVLRAFIPMS